MTVLQKLPDLRSQCITADLNMRERLGSILCSDLVVSSCPVTQLLTLYSGVSLIALGTKPEYFPIRDDIRCVGESNNLAKIQEAEVLSALGL